MSRLEREKHFWKLNMVIILLGAAIGWILYTTFYVGPFYPQPLNFYFTEYDNRVPEGTQSCFTAIMESRAAYDVNYTISVNDNPIYKDSMEQDNIKTVSYCITLPEHTNKISLQTETNLGNQTIQYIATKGEKNTVKLYQTCEGLEYSDTPIEEEECPPEKPESFYFLFGILLFFAPGAILYGTKGMENITHAMVFSVATFTLMMLILENSYGITNLNVTITWIMVMIGSWLWKNRGSTYS